METKDKEIIFKIETLLKQLKEFLQPEVQQPVEEFKVGAIVKDRQENFAAIVETRVTEVVCDNYSAHGGLMTIDKDRIFTTTEKEAADWLKSIAEKKYPVGTKVKGLNGKIYTIASKEFDIDIRATEVCARCKEFAGWFVVWELKTQKWADVITEPQKWKPSLNDFYWVCGLDMQVYKMRYLNNEVDYKFIACGNYFQTEPQAQEIATKIKELLK